MPVASSLIQPGDRPTQAALLKQTVFASCDEPPPAPVPGLTGGEREMVDTARQGYERLLWTMARDSSPKTAAARR